MANAHAAIPAYERSAFVSAVYRASLLMGGVASLAAAVASIRGGVSVAVGATVAISSFWALERTLAMSYGWRLRGARSWSVAAVAAKYALVGGLLFVASRVATLRMGYLAAGLAAVYAGVVVTLIRDMIRPNVAPSARSGSGSMG